MLLLAVLQWNYSYNSTPPFLALSFCQRLTPLLAVLQWNYSYNDVETPIAPAVGPMDVFQARHRACCSCSCSSAPAPPPAHTFTARRRRPAAAAAAAAVCSAVPLAVAPPAACS